ncbi:MAG: Spy/CpxP family protein refolding chaperone [Phycisphaerae bacterium]|jgi:Spy/CpxP family protein refolding chaperone|nr:Spy/CpxP family protein refolding chaperone [Phycisphaerae bacterium]HOO16428.1 Spy/CpxP family protein refolding chaperone [Phycisphaerae bacterium]HPC22572.1 Spy/CpxP family protein refolding chaperone [Phycisphaerae bacterium]HRS28518.1 Spy/CpxP family protein refolding chaperone [Phycisphaerae bacterium]HRT42333.1 Spy/CpxP family protein refolding chaperone [Phycisphaerae bacterium]
MRLQSITLTVVLGLASAVLAQNAPPPARPDAQDQARQNRPTEKQAGPNQPGLNQPGPNQPGQNQPVENEKGKNPPPVRPPEDQPRGPGAMLDRMGSRMIQTLNLTPAQAEQVRTIIDELRPDFEAAEPRELMLKLKEAQAAGDEQQIAALEAQMAEAAAKQDALRIEFFDRVEPILNPQQQQGLEQLRSRFSGERRGAVRLEGMIERLPEELQLTPEQRQKYDELAAAWRAARDQNREQRRALTRELTEAQKAGNEELLEELRQKLQEVRANRPSDAFYAGLEKILTKEQSEKLSEMRGVWGGPGERQRGLRVRTVVRAAERLDLTKEQREAIREITRQAMRQAREAKPEERAQTESQIAERLKKDITALLTPEQVTQFEQALKEGGRRGPRRPLPQTQPAPEGNQPQPKQP